jgi:hypothetical protein
LFDLARTMTRYIQESQTQRIILLTQRACFSLLLALVCCMWVSCGRRSSCRESVRCLYEIGRDSVRCFL